MPQRGADMGGRTWTGKFRLRPSLLGVVLEEMVITLEGEHIWKRPRFPVTIEKLLQSAGRK